MKNKLTLFLASLTALGLMGAATSCELFAPTSSSDSNPASTPNSTTSESVTSDSVVDSSDAGSSEEAATYMVTFVADGSIVGVVEYTAGAESITEPAVPSKDHYTGAWETYTLSGNITVNAVYTSVEYTVTFVADGETVGTATYTMDNQIVTEPAVPEKAGYTGAWEAYSMVDGGNITVNAVYTEWSSFTVNHITRAKTETVQATETVKSADTPEITPNTYDGYAYSGQVVDGTTINVYYDLVGVKYYAATTEGMITSRGDTTVAEKEVDGKTTVTYNRNVAGSSNHEMMIKAAGFTAGNYLVMKVKIEKNHDNPAWTFVEGAARTWADYKDYAVGMDDNSNNKKGWGYVIFAAPTSADGEWFYINWFDWTWLGDISVESVYEMTEEGYNAFFDIHYVDYTINHILRDGDTTQTADTSTVKSVDAPTVTPNTYDGYAYTETVTDGTVINLYYDKTAKLPNADEVLPEGVTKYAANLDILSGRGNTSVTTASLSMGEDVYSGLVHVTRANSVGASGNEVSISGSVATPGNYLVLLMYVENGAGSDDYSWVYSGGSQSWAGYYTLDKESLYPATNGGWYFLTFKPTAYSYSLSDYLVCLFDWHETSVYIASVYEMTEDGYMSYFGTEYTINHILKDGDAMETVDTTTVKSVDAPTVEPNTYDGYVYLETVKDGNVINVYYEKNTMKTYTVNHITRAKTETVKETTTVDSKVIPEVAANTYAGYAYSGQVVNGTIINVYYDLVGVKYYAATTEGMLSVKGAGTLTAGTKDDKAVMKYERPNSSGQGNEVMINASGYTAGNYVVIYAFISKTHNNPAYTWIQGNGQHWADYKDFAVDMNDDSSNDKGWGYIVFANPVANGANFDVVFFQDNYLGVDIAAVYEMTQEGYDAFFSDGMVEYTVKHITRAKTETVVDTTTMKAKEVPTVDANTYDGYAYSGQVVDGTTINVYYDLVGVKYYAATTEGLISARGASTVAEKVVDGKTTITMNRSTNGASGNEMMINAAGFTAGNYLVLKVQVTKTHDNPAYTWIQGAEQAWADYKDYAVGMDDSSSNEKGWGYVVFAAPTSADGTWFYVNWFDWNWLGDIAVEGVYEMTPEAYNTFFGIEA